MTSDYMCSAMRETCLLSILTSVKCHVLGIRSQGREENRALVQAMESGVERVWLYDVATLDIEALTEYSGQRRAEDMTKM